MNNFKHFMTHDGRQVDPADIECIVKLAPQELAWADMTEVERDLFTKGQLVYVNSVNVHCPMCGRTDQPV